MGKGPHRIYVQLLHVAGPMLRLALTIYLSPHDTTCGGLVFSDFTEEETEAQGGEVALATVPQPQSLVGPQGHPLHIHCTHAVLTSPPAG